MNDTVIKVEGVSKKFCKTLKHNMLYGADDLARSFFGLPSNSESLRGGEFWALEDVNFELRRGECLGLIGPNGAGKSTLLKILNGIIAPDKGRVQISGRVGALIEVGAGFHPLLTGRENIYVNGSILGFSKHEIDRKFDAIVDFSGIEEFIDSPVKHYSSGMYVRLGFAIAAQLESDILLIDEILAVGDAGFRSKCYNFIARQAERSAIILVSHAMPAISRLSTSTMVINRGCIAYHGGSADAISFYNRLFTDHLMPSRQGLGTARILSVDFLTTDGTRCDRFVYGQPLIAEIKVKSDEKIDGACIDLVFIGIGDEIVAECNSLVAGMRLDLSAGQELNLRVCISELTLNAGLYKISALIQSSNMMTHYDWIKDMTTIEVVAERVGIAGQQFLAIWDVLPDV